MNERRFWARANAILDWEIINDLKFQANFSANFDSHANNLFLESWNLGSLSQQDYYSKDYGSGYDLRMLYTLTYDHTFGEIKMYPERKRKVVVYPSSLV